MQGEGTKACRTPTNAIRTTISFFFNENELVTFRGEKQSWLERDIGMSNDMYTVLFTRIREKCQQQHWFGSDYENPFTQPEWMGGVARATRRWYESRGMRHAIERDTDLPSLPVYTNFEFPPATEEQLRAIEEILGFPLPPLLRALYAQLANGGFGPRYGIMGALGGYAHNFGTIVDAALMRRKGYRPLDLAECEKKVVN